MIKHGFDLEHQLHRLDHNVATIAESSATYATWTMDQQAAELAVRSIGAFGDLEQVQIINDLGKKLAKIEYAVEPPSWLEARIAGLFEQQWHKDLPLVYVRGGEQHFVGTLSYTIAARPIARNVLSFACSIFAIILIQSFLVALILFIVSTRSITKPLGQLVSFIRAVNIERVDRTRLALERYPRLELNLLASCINTMLDSLQRSQSKLHELATIDPLTGQANRRLIVDQLDQAIAAAQQQQHGLAVLFIDVDQFKTINDSLGHEVGDHLLKHIAKRFETQLPAYCSVGRLGGDEFLIFLEYVFDIEDVRICIEEVVAIFDQPFVLLQHSIAVTCSIGAALYPQDGGTSAELMSRADLAMYQIKGRVQRWHLYDDSLMYLAEHRFRVHSSLHTAFSQQQFELYYQPKVCTDSAKLYGAEALIRWRSDSNPITASEFIDAAEECGLIVELGYWIIEQVCLQLQAWQAYAPELSISLNLSCKQLQEPNFLSKTLKIINAYSFNTSQLEFEITETVAMRDIDNNVAIFKALRAQNIKISIDDFGTGYSSLAYLAQLPLDFLKIDRSFISGPKKSEAILNIIIQLARTLKIRIVAEGIETQTQSEWLQRLGVSLQQGYWLGYALPIEEFEQSLFKVHPDLLDA